MSWKFLLFACKCIILFSFALQFRYFVYSLLLRLHILYFIHLDFQQLLGTALRN